MRKRKWSSAGLALVLLAACVVIATTAHAWRLGNIKARAIEQVRGIYSLNKLPNDTSISADSSWKDVSISNGKVMEFEVVDASVQVFGMPAVVVVRVRRQRTWYEEEWALSGDRVYHFGVRDPEGS